MLVLSLNLHPRHSNPEAFRRMFVTKRDGEKEEVKFDKITSRIRKLCDGLNSDFVDPVSCTRGTPLLLVL